MGYQFVARLKPTTLCLSCRGRAGDVVPVQTTLQVPFRPEFFHATDVPDSYLEHDPGFCAFYADLKEPSFGQVDLPSPREFSMMPAVDAGGADLSAAAARYAAAVDGKVPLLDYASTALADVRALLRLRDQVLESKPVKLRAVPPPGCSTEIQYFFIGVYNQTMNAYSYSYPASLPTSGFSGWVPWPFPTTVVNAGIPISTTVKFKTDGRWYGLIRGSTLR